MSRLLLWVELAVCEVHWRAVEVGYGLRPYDAHLDGRRWRWATPGCVRSRRALLRALRESGR